MEYLEKALKLKNLLSDPDYPTDIDDIEWAIKIAQNQSISKSQVWGVSLDYIKRKHTEFETGETNADPDLFVKAIRWLKILFIEQPAEFAEAMEILRRA